jgi:uncharacterized pyridoxamine 5'-phosphate oxidase family protein
MTTSALNTSINLQSKREKIFGFIKNHPTAVLTTVDPDGNPHGSVIYYTTDEDHNVLFITKEQTKKYDNLSHNPHAMLVVYDQVDEAILQISGIANVVPQGYDSQLDFAAVLSSSMQASGYPFSPISKLSAGPYVVYKIIPVQLRLTTYTHPNQGTVILEGEEL